MQDLRDMNKAAIDVAYSPVKSHRSPIKTSNIMDKVRNLTVCSRRNENANNFKLCISGLGR